MATAHIKVPSDPNSEIFYDPKQLRVAFRKRDDKPKKELQVKVLRVVVQCFGWVIEDRFFPQGSRITIGAGRRNTFRIPTRDLPDRHRLIDYSSTGSIELRVNKHFSGVIQSEKKLKSLSDLIKDPGQTIAEVQLPPGSKGCLEHGTMLIYFEEIPDPEKVPPVAIFKSLGDPQFVRWFIASLGLHLLLLLVALVMPVKVKEVTLETLAPSFKRILVEPQKFKEFVPKGVPNTGLRRGAVGREGEGARAAGPEGRRGKNVPGAGQRLASKDIKRTGILDVFSRRRTGSALDALVGGGSGISGDVDKSFNRAARYGLPGERELREGKGLAGSGKGGGGLSTSIGQGLGTKGVGGGAKGPGLADFGTGRSDTAVSADIDEEEVFIMGNIPKEVIAKIIADHMGHIKFCYQRQLQVKPDLRGKIVTDFIIGLEGTVTSAQVKKSSMNSPPVENCVLGVLRRLQFPKPGGGVVQVVYPFSFRVAG